MSRARRSGLGLVPVLAVVVISRALVPAPPTTVPPDPAQRVWTGAYHVHTTRSDGSGTPSDVAAAAAQAGRDFVILTDHGDGTRDPLPPAYMSGVLVIDAVEVSTADGHYVALDMPQAPYPLAGEARDVAEDVARLGGVGILAHPDSARPALAWHDARTRGDGLEILNADSAWRDESPTGLARGLLSYPWRPASVLATTLSYPSSLLAVLDAPDAIAEVPRLALAGVDAHARVGWSPGDEPMTSTRTLARLPGYAASFGTFGLAMSWPDGSGPSGDASRDARSVLDALRTGALHIVVFALADAAPLRFTARTPTQTFTPGTRVMSEDGITLEVDVPPVDGARVRLLRDGRPWREASGTMTLTADVERDAPPATYRAEVWLPRRWQQPMLPWMVSQAITIAPPHQDRQAASALLPSSDSADLPAAGAPLTGAWHAEHDDGSQVAITQPSADLVEVRTVLKDGADVSQFGAAVVDWPGSGTSVRVISFTGTARQPMRVSVQVREPKGADGWRWARSVYLDSTPRDIRVELSDMRPIWPAQLPATQASLHALLFVVDTVNAAPGDTRQFSIERLRLQ